MSAGLVGADPDDLERLAVELDAARDHLVSVDSRLSAAVRSTRWSGPDCQRFQAEWPQGSMRLRAAASALGEAATTARRNAAEQRTTSEAASGALVGSGALAGSAAGSQADVAGAWTPSGGWNGWSGGASVDGQVSSGPVTWAAGGSVETLTGHAGVSSDVHGLRYDPVTGAWLPAAASVGAYAGYNLAAVSTHGSARLGVAEVSANGSVKVGGEVSTTAEAFAGPDGVGAHVGAGGSAGVRADGSASASVAGQDVTASGHVIAGVELQADADMKLSLDKIELSAGFSAALGLGGGGHVKIELDPLAAAHTLGQLTHHLW